MRGPTATPPKYLQLRDPRQRCTTNFQTPNDKSEFQETSIYTHTHIAGPPFILRAIQKILCAPAWSLLETVF